MSKRSANDSSLSSDDSIQVSSVNKRRSRKREDPLPQYKATVQTLAESAAAMENSSIADVDPTILSKIKKCLDRANHPTTPEAEAKAALFIASRLMGQYNVTQAEILSHEPAEKQKDYAGHSIVSILRVDGDKSKKVQHQNFVDTLCSAVNKFFDCKYYTTAQLWSLDVTFYGIAQNTITAARAFEMLYNVTVEWARPYKGIGSKNSYCLGVSNEQYNMAKREKAR